MATKATPNPMTPENHAFFDACVKKWQDKLGLQGWRIERSKKKTKELAQVEMHHIARLASYRVGNDWGSLPITDFNIESTVVHELKHILLYNLVNQVEIGLTGEALEAEEHLVIHVLEKLAMGAPA